MAENHPGYKLIHLAEPAPFSLDSTTKILMDIISNILIGLPSSYSLCGGYVRNMLLGKRYNDFDISCADVYTVKSEMSKMGVLQVAEDTFGGDGVRLHDYFINPYDLSGTKHPVHWIETDNLQGYTPLTFDYSLNEFCLKEDGMIYAPTYAWKHLRRKELHLNNKINLSTNIIVRGIRFAALSGFSLAPKTVEAFKDYAANHKGDYFRIERSIHKMIEDGVSSESFTMMQKLELFNAAKYSNIYEYLHYVSQRVDKKDYTPERQEYHDFEDTPGHVLRGILRDTDGFNDPFGII